ncbi:disulfide bond formation protein DsbB [Neisseria sp. HMSC073G10]|uniref:disulfide bond formation protein B n=1 Tax=Neisseria sp. HMSC073G10 TaxID=1739369 RepID=UPI0008A61F4D|nr:disulfide bond formation protein B [Neisseria sp. HMSC073G10]OFR84687.1 disulfide bond formation protein DsbB [Neisseria sp. HMSC073G10]
MNFFRKTVLFLVVLSIFAACGSFISQYVLGMNPCVLCILQRLCVLAVGLLAIVTAFSSQSSRFARSLSALLIAAPAVYGAGVAAYQIWLQSLPPGTAPSCGAPWTFRLRDWPLFDWFEPIVRGFGNCAEPDYLFGVTLPVWSILYFGFVVLLLLWAWLKTRKI